MEEFWLIVALEGAKMRQNSGPRETAEQTAPSRLDRVHAHG